jgi:hypothetical protein
MKSMNRDIYSYFLEKSENILINEAGKNKHQTGQIQLFPNIHSTYKRYA